jgi:preprotein translocase subunit SecE
MAVETKTGAPRPVNPLVKYFKDIRSEFRKITWPSKDEIIDTTKKVFVVVAIFALILSLYDSVFGKALSYIITLIK